MSAADGRKRSDRWPGVLLVGLFLVLTLPAALMGRGGFSEKKDEELFHLPLIRAFAEQWPSVNVREYESATTPGYHLVMAVVWRAAGEEWALRLVNALLGAGLVLAAWWGARGLMVGVPRAGWWAAGLVLPLMMNAYVLGGSMSLVTDNAALLFVALVLIGSAVGAERGPISAGRGIACGLCAAAAVMVRQVHAWSGGVIAAAGLIASPMAALLPGAVGRALRGERTGAGRWSSAAWGMVGLALPIAVTGFFVWLWGGLVPVSGVSADFHGRGANPAAPAFALALLGALGPWFVVAVWVGGEEMKGGAERDPARSAGPPKAERERDPARSSGPPKAERERDPERSLGPPKAERVRDPARSAGPPEAEAERARARSAGPPRIGVGRRMTREVGLLLRDRRVWVAAVVGMAAALAVPTSAQLPTETTPPPDGRGYGWLWRIAMEVAHRAMPNVAERSAVIAALAPAGAVVVVVLWRGVQRAGRGRAGAVLLIGMLGWLAAQAMNFQVWQRYYEPVLLMFLALLTACGVRGAASQDDGARREAQASVPGLRGVHGSSTRWRSWLAGYGGLAGVAVLALVQFGLSAITLYREVLRGP